MTDTIIPEKTERNQLLTVSRIKFIKKVTTKYGERHMFAINFNEFSASATFFSSTDDLEEFKEGDQRHFKITESEGKINVKLVPIVKRNIESEEKILMLGEAIRCAVSLYAAGKCTKEKLEPTVDHFYEMIKRKVQE